MKYSIIIIIFTLISINLPALENNDNFPVNDKTRNGISVFIAYPVICDNDNGSKETISTYGAGAGLGIDFGGDIPIINLSGIELYGSYSFLHNRDEIHYFSTGIGLFIKSAFSFPLNAGFRAGGGSGWIIFNKINPETSNNDRTNGAFFYAAPFIEINLFSGVYVHAGLEKRSQHLVFDEENIKVDLDVYYLRLGVRL